MLEILPCIEDKKCMQPIICGMVVSKLLQNLICALRSMLKFDKKAVVSFLELIDLEESGWLLHTLSLSLGSIAGFMDHQITYIEQQAE